MASRQIPLAGPATTSKSPSHPCIALPTGFKFNEVDIKYKHGVPSKQLAAAPPPPLGVLSNFSGTFSGTGFNTIFRPNNGVAKGNTTFPIPVTPAPPAIPDDNALELNLTTETLAFSPALGNVPNRGFGTQADIFLNGVPYVQSINDVANPDTGKANGPAVPIHFEPGLWMHIPATTSDPVLGESLVRMASIPHGTTINAQTSAIITIKGAPNFLAPPNIVDITPFVIGQPNKPIKFPSQTLTNPDTARIPQDLSKFNAAGTITQAILDNPNVVLQNAIKGQNIISFIVFVVDTTPQSPELGGGTANIAFLGGIPGSANGPNANAIDLKATFWIETVEHKIVVPAWKPGYPALKIPAPAPHPGAKVPYFSVHPPHEIKEPKTITVHSTQIQYSQKVILNFAGLSWPHVSVATLVPEWELPVPASAWE